MRIPTMKNDFTSKWAEHSKEGWKAGVFRVFPEHFLDFFIGFSVTGEKEFTFLWLGTKAPRNLKGGLKYIDIIHNEDQNKNVIVLRLINKDLSDLFTIVCFDLAEATKTTQTVSAGVNIFFNRLQRWIDLLSKSHSKKMTYQELLGLIGELTMLKWCIEETSIPVNVLIRGWRGPDGDTNDIGVNGNRLEIKSQLSTQPAGLNISSITQLIDEGQPLYVVLHRFSASSEGVSLLDLVNSIVGLIGTDRHALMHFQRKLILAGFSKDDECINEAMNLDRHIVYQVRPDFPRLQPCNIPNGVSHVSYFIDASVITDFEIEIAKLGILLDES
jgi:hypothetical protein